ncbi:MAG: amidohydrolase [Dehalococcoidia bacterium]|nr:amidohydrolase [Dehalococcoidia bacterium]|tara:strand:- start:749 stop:2047 length:1299 start_codon:yes stop_codon:yes gene_type:complete
MRNNFTIKGASLVLTLEPSIGLGKLGLSRDLDIRIENGLIVEVGKNLPGSKDETLDASGKIVMPGFVDCHDHLWQTLIRGCGLDQGLSGWLEECVFAVARAGLSRNDVYHAVRLGSFGLIETGVTTVLDWSHAFDENFVEANLSALSDSGLRFGYGFYCQNNPERYLRAQEIKDMVDGDTFALLHICAHPAIESIEELANTFSVAEKLDLSFDVHLLESPEQIDQKPFEALQKSGAVNFRLLADHVVHLSSEEIHLLSTSSARITHNPLSNMRLGSGVAKLPEMKESGLAMGLGLDGGTNDFPDFFTNMKMAVGLQRARSNSASAFPSTQDALWLATMGGANVLKLQDKIGSLKAGKFADLIFINPTSMNFGPDWNWVDQIVFSGQPQAVTEVIVAGNFLKRNGALVDTDVSKTVKKVNNSALELKERLKLV